MTIVYCSPYLSQVNIIAFPPGVTHSEYALALVSIDAQRRAELTAQGWFFLDVPTAAQDAKGGQVS